MAIFNQYNAGPSASSAAGVMQRASSQFPSPWLDPASAELPTHLEDVFKFCELLWYSNGTYQQALNRIAAYFVTRVKIDGVDEEEKERWDKYLREDLNIEKFMVGVGRNFLAYGNVMMSPRVAINRVLRDPKSGSVAPISQWNFRFQNGRFSGSPKIEKRGVERPLERMDFRPLTQDALDIRVWNPYTMKVKFNSITERMIYRHVLPRDDAQMIRKGDPDFLEDTPWEFVQAALDRQPLRIHNDRIFHLKDVPLAGIDADGMGVPRAMANFRQAFQAQVMQRLNMVLAMEYSTPFRALTPEPGANEAMDPTMGVDMSMITGKLSALVADWKRDPAAIHHFPIPVRYTAWGGEGLQMVSHEIANQTMEQLLTGIGVPVDFFVGTFKSERTFVPTLRLLERTWAELVSGYNAVLVWLADTLSDLLRWKRPELSMEPVTVADDIDLRNILLDLYMQGRVSGSTAFDTLRLSPVDENKKMLTEQVQMQADADEASAKQQQATQGLAAVSSTFQAGSAPQGGGGGAAAQAPGAGAGAPSANNTPQRPEQILQQATQYAEQLLAMSPQERAPVLAELRNTNQVLHGVVMQELEKGRSYRGSDQGQAAMAQQGAAA